MPKKDEFSGLTPNQRKFAYLAGLPDEKGRFRSLTDCYMAVYAHTASRENCKREGWKIANLPHVKAVIDRLREEHFQELEDRVKVGIGRQSKRIAEKQKRHDRLNELLDARQTALTGMARHIENLQTELASCKDETRKKEIEVSLESMLGMLGVGEDTGLLARDFKEITGKIVPVFRLDKALLDALNDIENDVAKELGQIVTKSDINHEFGKLSDADLIARAKELFGATPDKGNQT
ncbi:MAG TPA: hypothetical protein VG944_20355 [Fimbriimonas sp.]|nr:hypothetical protein [Fimbriimonas sp.]